jgi:predicted glycoside hydrolase/deacetylase ChbG (UPF0249 family)
VAAGAFFLFANEGFWNLMNRTREAKRLEQILVHLRSDHAIFSEEWTRIQRDPTYTDYLIRKNLGYVKKGEVEYRILVSSHS